MGEGLTEVQIPETKSETKLQKIISPLDRIYCHLYSSINTVWGPCSREGASLNSYNGKLYLYGGAGVTISEEVIIAEI
jgi:hypothetical protein